MFCYLPFQDMVKPVCSPSFWPVEGDRCSFLTSFRWPLVVFERCSLLRARFNAFKSAMSHISYLFDTTVANEHGHLHHFWYIVMSIPTAPTSVQSALRNQVFYMFLYPGPSLFTLINLFRNTFFKDMILKFLKIRPFATCDECRICWTTLL